MRKNFIFSIIALCCIISSGCSTLHVMRLKPVSQQIVWSQGREIVATQNNNIAAQIAFDRYIDSEKRMYFDVEFTNNSAGPVVVDPGMFYYSAFSKVADSLSEKSKGQIFKTIDPEAELLAIDTKIRDAVSLHEKLLVAGAVIDIALIFIDKSEKTDEERRAEADEKEHNEIESEIAYRESLKKLYDQRDFWEKESLRKTTLPPGESIRGFIAAPAQQRVRALQLYLPCGSSENVITFHQEVF